MAKKKSTSSNQEVREPLKGKTGFEKIKFKLKCKNQKQKEYSRLIKEKQITICSGAAGSGKSYVALATALELLKDPNTPYKKLVLMVPPVQSDIEVGYLKGDLDAKLYNHAFSYLWNLADMMGGDFNQVLKLKEEGFIEVMCVSFSRGINLKECICICGECQQYSMESFLTLITRPCDSAKMIFEGDENQIDNKNIRRGREKSGLSYSKKVLREIPEIGFMEFDKNDIVRNPLITRILELWDPDTYGG